MAICITRESNQRVREGLDAGRGAVVLDLDPAEKIVEMLVVRDRLSNTGRRELVNESLGLEVSRDVGPDDDVLWSRCGRLKCQSR